MECRPSLRPFDVYHTTWQYDVFYWTAFVPESIDLRGTILGCIDYTRSTLPVLAVADSNAPHQQSWCLDPKVLKKWDQMWMLILRFTSNLKAMAMQNFPLGTKIYAPPTACGYAVQYERLRDLKDAAMRAKAAVRITYGGLAVFLALAGANVIPGIELMSYALVYASCVIRVFYIYNKMCQPKYAEVVLTNDGFG